jgi:hypothetical protein
MCRSIKTLFNFNPPATDDEVRAAALQFVRKLSGFNTPSKVNEAAFGDAVDECLKWRTASSSGWKRAHRRATERRKRRRRGNARPSGLGARLPREVERSPRSGNRLAIWASRYRSGPSLA